MHHLNQFRGNYSATSNNIKLVHWPLMGGLLHLVQRGGDWTGPQPRFRNIATETAKIAGFIHPSLTKGPRSLGLIPWELPYQIQ